MKRTLLPVAIVVAALVAAWSAAAEAEKAAPPPDGALRGKVREEIAFSLAAEFPNAQGREYGLTRVQKGGDELPPPANMKLDPKTGAFSWTPTPSQAGDYEIHFLIRNPEGENAHASRRVAIETPPIVPPNDQSEIAKLLRQWHKEGTAAGNLGDFYDNRDRGHSMLNTAPYPQLDRIEYSKEQLDRRLDWALQLHFLYPHVVFGNSSTASGDPNLGSNARHALYARGGPEILYNQYTHNHLYIYPEHRDHDPGHNGRGGGYGDLLPANAPFLIVSQGSSGSDQSFMRAVPYALAALRPEVKQLLTERGLLAPTLQMLLRRSTKAVDKPEDYFSPRAHPTVFMGSELSALKMVQLAHELARDSVPPMVQIASFEEDLALAGRDYFEAGLSERLFDTPAVIARVARSTKHTRRMVVSARGSYDVNARPLTFRWVVLRGDADRIAIKPVEEDGSAVELLVPPHEWQPTFPGSPIGSSRVDIGVFAHNGAHWSAPAFISITYLDDEARTYDAEGRILEMGYGYGDSTLGCPSGNVRARDKAYDVTDWPALLAVVGNDKGGLPSELLRARFSAEELAELAAAAKELEPACAAEDEAQKKRTEASAAFEKARAAVVEAKKKLDAARVANERKPTDATKAAFTEAEASLKALQDDEKKAQDAFNDAKAKHTEAEGAPHRVLTRERPPLKGSVKRRIEAALNELKNDPTLYLANAKAIHQLADACNDAGAKRAFLAARDGLVKFGILKAEGDGFRLSPVAPGPKPPAERLTRFERNRIEWFHIEMLQRVVYPGMLNRSYRPNFVQAFMGAQKSWRDVYHYDEKGRRTGWTRYDGGGEPKDFTSDGCLVTKKDALGRALEARTVEYFAEGDRGRRTLKMKLGDTVRRYEYESDKDRVGRVAGSEKAAK